MSKLNLGIVNNNFFFNNEIMINDIKDDYSCIRDFLNDIGIYDPNLCSIAFSKEYYITDEYLPFYYKNEKFGRIIQYADLPFEEFHLYGIGEDAKLTEPQGKGGGDTDLLSVFLVIYNAYNEFLKNNPIINNVALMFALGCIIKTCFALNSVVDKPESIFELLKFVKRNKIDLNFEKLNYQCYSEKEKAEIENGIKTILELDGSAMIEEAIRKMAAENKENYEEYLKKQKWQEKG